MTTCPCGSGNLYADCCGPIIKNDSAATALILMKSRYTAYCIGAADYLCNTASPRITDTKSRTDIAQWSQENTWTGLEIISCEQGGPNDTAGTVEFKASYKDPDGILHIHHERSRFRKENNCWRYIDGVFEPKHIVSQPKIERNSTCPCGSGKKYKKCCG